MTRTDAILEELSLRHKNDHPEFLAAVRPMVERILAPGLPEQTRVELLEMLAETFERDVQIRTDIAQAKSGFAAFFERLRRLIQDG